MSKTSVMQVDDKPHDIDGELETIKPRSMMNSVEAAPSSPTPRATSDSGSTDKLSLSAANLASCIHLEWSAYTRKADEADMKHWQSG